MNLAKVLLKVVIYLHWKTKTTYDDLPVFLKYFLKDFDVQNVIKGSY